MDKSPKPLESKLYDIWQNQSFNSNLKTISGEEINVLDAGILNNDTAGPDFRNARIRIGNLLYVGDIEIDCDYSHWKLHGHNIDSKHNKVILHACLTNKHNQQYVYTKDGRRVPTICLSRFLLTDFSHEFKNEIHVVDGEPNSRLKCAHMMESVDFTVKKKFVSSLGMDRYKKKSRRIFDRLKELAFLNELKLKEPVIRYDLKPEFEQKKFSFKDFSGHYIWNQLLYENVFEALGYSKNKNIMQKLAQSANLDFLIKLIRDENFLDQIESALFNISGLIPEKIETDNDEISSYIKKMEDDWLVLSRIYDGKTFHSADWHFFKLRPQNFPTIRIAGGIKFLGLLLKEDLVSTIVKKFTEIRNLTVLINSIRSLFVIKSRGFWKKHYVFDRIAKDEIKYFIGASRADEIIVNVILPFFTVYFDIFGKHELSKKVIKTYNLYNQRTDNRIVKEVAEGLNAENFLKKTVLTQGMLELFRNYCSKKKCLDCEIGKLVFN
ncbi:DUF2851 family protein [Bacteroidota bacterium]